MLTNLLAHKKLKESTKKKFIESFEEEQSATEDVETITTSKSLTSNAFDASFKLFEYNDNHRFVYFLR
jgi:hypothetical protein